MNKIIKILFVLFLTSQISFANTQSLGSSSMDSSSQWMYSEEDDTEMETEEVGTYDFNYTFDYDYESDFSAWEDSFENFMSDFETNLDSQMEQMYVQIDNMMEWIMSQVDAQLEDTFAMVEQLSEELPTKVVDLMDTRLEKYFNNLWKYSSEVTLSKLDKLTNAIDKVESSWKIKDEQVLDILNYMWGLTDIEKWEVIKEEAQTIIDSDEEVTKDDLQDIKSLFEELNVSDVQN